MGKYQETSIPTISDSNLIAPDKVLNVYLWGSRVYGTALPDADWDIVVVLKDEAVLKKPVLSGMYL